MRAGNGRICRRIVIVVTVGGGIPPVAVLVIRPGIKHAYVLRSDWEGQVVLHRMDDR